MRNVNVRYRQDADSAAIVSYEVTSDGDTVGKFDKPTGQLDGVEQSVTVAIDEDAGTHTFTLTAVDTAGTKSPVSNAVIVTLPSTVAAPVLVSVE